MKRSYKIYKIHNTVNNKVYIGQTVNSLPDRFCQHCNNGNHKLRSDIDLFGKDSFTIELIDDSAKNNKELASLEGNYIEIYNSINNGYNIANSSVSSANLMKALKITKAITLDEEIVELLEQLAEKEDRSLSNQINKILKDYFLQNEKPVN